MKTEETQIVDLFDNMDSVPAEVRAIFDQEHLADGLSYQDCADLLKQVEKLGYSFEYGLDASPYNLRKL